jgi:hypothetical protein
MTFYNLTIGNKINRCHAPTINFNFYIIKDSLYNLILKKIIKVG